MKNEQLITKILEKIGYKDYILNKPICIDDEYLVFIINNKSELSNSDFRWVVANDKWEIPISYLRNRELTKLYQLL